jgi:hypothetical protein
MATTPVPNPVSESADGRAQALAQALSSHTFTRSEQLRGFLKYICELAGRGAEISECQIGQDVLGRKTGFNPVDDASVRNRAHALRRKLDELYASELAGAAMRIELPKGSYRPRFVSRESLPAAGVSVQPRRALAAAFLAGLLVAAAGAGIYWRFFAAAPAPGQDRVLREVWGPLLAPDAATIVCVGTPLQLFVRPYPVDLPPIAGEQSVLLLDREQDRKIYEAYLRRRELPAGHELFANPTNNSPLWGDGIGALLATQVLSQAGASYELWPERAGSPTIMRGRNVILFAREEYSETARLVSRNENFIIQYSPEHRNVAVFNQQPVAGEQAVYPLDPPGQRRVSYGLVTVMPSPGVPGQERRTVVISGLTSAGIQAAAEFFTSPRSLGELKERFRKEGIAGVPAHYQVLIRTMSVDTMPRAWSVQTHRVLAR